MQNLSVITEWHKILLRWIYDNYTGGKDESQPGLSEREKIYAVFEGISVIYILFFPNRRQNQFIKLWQPSAKLKVFSAITKSTDNHSCDCPSHCS
jgi:hypothetical protein